MFARKLTISIGLLVVLAWMDFAMTVATTSYLLHGFVSPCLIKLYLSTMALRIYFQFLQLSVFKSSGCAVIVIKLMLPQDRLIEHVPAILTFFLFFFHKLLCIYLGSGIHNPSFIDAGHPRAWRGVMYLYRVWFLTGPDRFSGRPLSQCQHFLL
jgi:hypothetical protein